MGNLVSFLRGYKEVDDLTLENAVTLLNVDENETQIINESPSDISENFVCTKTGTITEIKNETCVIDDSFMFKKTCNNFVIGSKVRYNLFNSNNIFKVTNVELINDDWDLVENTESFWSNRIFICQVEKRVGRKLTLTMSNIIVDLDDAPLEFLPIVGDWLELDVKCVINENSLNLSGEIIEINKISPLRPHIEEGKITNWRISEENGTINNKLYFNKSALSIGYIPTLGDKVVAEIIESDQNRCSWRAIKVVPENLYLKYGKVSKISRDIPVLKESHPELNISDVKLTFDKLGETKMFYFDILNTSSDKFSLDTAEFLDTNRQCQLKHIIKMTEILPGENKKIECECTSKNIGITKEMLILNFGSFTLGKWVHIFVSVENRCQRISTEYKTNKKPHKESNNELIKGQGPKTVRFLTRQIPNYSVPDKLMHAVTNIDSNKREDIIKQLKLLIPSLFSNLSHINYENKFHTLLHLDEIANLVAIRTYDQEKVCFIRNNEYLMLEINNLSERRPSLVLGDKIIATDPMNNNGLDFEGFIHKVGAKHVYIKFNQMFHENYNGEDYSIKVVPGRSHYKRLHHAVHLATRNLGQDLLFPTRILEKDVQVDFCFEKYYPLSPNSVKTNKMKNVLNRMQEHKQNSAKASSEESYIKLEWYNPELNSFQKNAVVQILWGKARPLPYIIFGPPGTGKTVTVIETILQIVRLIPSSRLLVTAPSNSAADLISLRLINSGVLLPGDLIRVISYNYALSDMIPAKLIPYCATVTAAKEGTTSTTNTSGIQFDCSLATLGRHKITVSTCSSAGQFFGIEFPKGHFSHIIIDEAAQAGEPDVMIPMSFLDKYCGQVILSGDPMQLGPVVICKTAAECGLQESYLERIINRFPYICDPVGFLETSGFDPRLITKLLYNYRALPDILNLYSLLFYNNELIPTIDENDSKEAKLLESLREILPIKHNKPSQVVFHGVDGENYQTTDSPSWYNPHEAAQVFYYVNEFYRLGINLNNLGIITPYVKQVREIRSLLAEAEFDLPRIGTIEEFQGQEFDIIVLSTVRSHEEYISSDVHHSLGFVASPKRLNVAISRSKSLLLIIGNPRLLCHDMYWRSVVKYCVDNGSYIGCEF